MKALTVLQPMASFLVNGEKHLETRSYYLNPGEQFAVHSGKSDRAIKYFQARCKLSLDTLSSPRGYILGIATVEKVWKISIKKGLYGNCLLSSPILTDINSKATIDIIKDGWHYPWDLRTCEFIDGWYAMEVSVKALETPIPAKGQQKIWEWEPKE